MGAYPSDHRIDAERGGSDLVSVTVPGKLDTKTVFVPKEQAKLRERALARLIGTKSIAGITTFSEVIGSLADGYSERALAILFEAFRTKAK